MSLTITVKPLGGGDYTTVQAAYDYAVSQSANDFIIETYSGGNLGLLMMEFDLATGSTLRFTVAAGHRHNGSLSAGAYILSDTDYYDAIYITIPIEAPLIFEYLRVVCSDCDSPGASVAISASSYGESINYTIDGLLCQQVSTGGYGPGNYIFSVYLTQESAGGTMTFKVRNTIFASFADWVGPQIFHYNYSDALAYLTLEIDNCVSINGSILLYVGEAGSSGTMDLDARIVNNYASDAPFGSGCFQIDFSDSIGTLAYTFTDNGSEDATGNLTLLDPADQFANPASDWSLLGTSDLLGEGTDLSADFTNTAYDGQVRSTPWNIGAWQESAGGGGFTIMAIGGGSRLGVSQGYGSSSRFGVSQS